MLAEFIHFLATPCPRGHRRHLAAAVSLWSRERRCRAAWEPHYARSREACAASWRDAARRERAVVLGSGLARDVDLPALSAAFREVVLVDIVHLWPVRLRARRLGNVRLATADLSRPGALEPWRETADWIVSANVLSQLPLFPGGQGAVLRHLEALRGCRGRVCLIADTERLRRAWDGREAARLDLLEGAALPPAPLAWEWAVAPFGEAERGHAWVHRVAAYPDFRTAS